MARIDVLMPQMGESIAEGTVSKWLKKVGDAVQRDEPLFEISTDKVDAEIPSPNAGVLAEIKVQEGQTVPVLTLVAVLETDAKAGAASCHSRPAARTRSSEAAPAPVAAPTAPPVAAAQRAPAAPGAPVAAVAPATAAPDRPTAASSTADCPDRRFDPTPLPIVSAPSRRRSCARSRQSIRSISRRSRVRASRAASRNRTSWASSRKGLRRLPAPLAALDRPRPPDRPTAAFVAPPVEAWPGDRVEPFSKIRKITADHMVMSRRISAHVTSFFEVDFTHIAELRRKNKASYTRAGREPHLPRVHREGVRREPAAAPGGQLRPCRARASSIAAKSTSGSRWRWIGD